MLIHGCLPGSPPYQISEIAAKVPTLQFNHQARSSVWSLYHCSKILFFALQYFRANFILIFSAMFAKVYPLRLYGDLHVSPLKLLPKFSHFANFTAKMLFCTSSLWFCQSYTLPCINSQSPSPWMSLQCLLISTPFANFTSKFFHLYSLSAIYSTV